MLEPMTSVHTNQNIIYTIAEENLNDEDHDRIIMLLQEKIRTLGKIRWYFELRDFKGWALSTLWNDLKLGLKYSKDLEMIAIVGDKKWEKRLIQLMKPFTNAEIKFFEDDDREEAKIWISRINHED